MNEISYDLLLVDIVAKDPYIPIEMFYALEDITSKLIMVLKEGLKRC